MGGSAQRSKTAYAVHQMVAEEMQIACVTTPSTWKPLCRPRLISIRVPLLFPGFKSIETSRQTSLRENIAMTESIF